MFFLMIRRPPRSTRTDTLFPYSRSSDLLIVGADALTDMGGLAIDRHASGNNQLFHLAARTDAGIGQHLMPFWHERRSEEHTSALQSLMRIPYALFCLKKTTSTLT